MYHTYTRRKHGLTDTGGTDKKTQMSVSCLRYTGFYVTAKAAYTLFQNRPARE